MCRRIQNTRCYCGSIAFGFHAYIFHGAFLLLNIKQKPLLFDGVNMIHDEHVTEQAL